MSFFLGIDIGTSGVKALLMSSKGDILKTETVNYNVIIPKNGWIEQNPEDWWDATKKVIRKIITDSNINTFLIKGISFSGQMHTSVFLDENMEVIRPAILWNDMRTSTQCKEIYEFIGGKEEFIRSTGNLALEGFTLPKLLWLKDNELENYKKLKYLLMPKDYIRYKLTGEIFTDYSDAAGTVSFNVLEKEWSNKIIETFEIDPNIFPTVVNSIGVVGEITKEASKETDLKEGTLVIAGGADNACGAIGSGIIEEGKALISIGTSGTVLAQVEKPKLDVEGRLHLFNHAKAKTYYLMGVMLSAGMSFKWMKENLFNNKYSYDELNNMAKNLSVGSEGLIFLPYLNGERTPYGDANARGVYFGISGKHKIGHFARSTIEGVSFGLKQSLEIIEEQIEINEVRLIGGGGKSKLWQRVLADIIGKEINILNIEEGPAFGAALIAAVGAKEYKDFHEAVNNNVKIKGTIEPNYNHNKRYQEYYSFYKKLYLSLKDDYKEFSRLI